MSVYLQPIEVDLSTLADDPPFLTPENEEKFKGQPIDKVLAEEKQRLAIVDQARREFDMEQQQAEFDGKLPDAARAFRDTVLKPRLTEIHEFKQQIRTPVVDGLLFRNTLAWIAGPSGTFKSFVTADLAFRYGSENLDYHGRKMTHGRALLVIAEGGGAYADRRAAWEKQYDQDVKGVTIYPAPLQLADTLKEMPALLSVLKEADENGEPYGLVVFDTQAMCTVGVDENKSEMNLVINVLHRIREVSGACVLAVHHYGKKKESGMRGSSMLYAAADTVIEIEREKEGGMTVSLSTDGENGKQKDAPAEKDAVSLKMESQIVGVTYFEDPLTSLVAVAADKAHDVTDDKDHPQVTIPDVTPRQMIYLKGLNYYEEKGTSPAYMARYMTQDMGYSTDAPNVRNCLVALGKKGLAEQPAVKGPWYITPLGVSVLAAEVALGNSWASRAARARQMVSGEVSEGQTKLPDETFETSDETSDETSPDLQ